MDFIGWYITGDSANSMDIKIHKQICEINESPIMLKLNPFDKNIDVRIVILKQYINNKGNTNIRRGVLGPTSIVCNMHN